MQDDTTQEYPRGTGWRFEEFSDGVWLHVLGPDGEQLASFRPKTYDRPEQGRMRAGA